MCCGSHYHSELAEPRVEHVPEPVPQQVEGQDDQQDREAREQRHPPRARDVVPPSAIIDPHAGVGGGIPAPRNESAASTMMTYPTWRLTRTTSVLAVLGKRWNAMIRTGEAPRARAWAMKSRSMSATTSP